MDTIHTIHLIHISTILAHTTMVLEMDITILIIEITITIIFIITTIIVTTEILVIPITQEEQVVPITNQLVQQEHLNHKIHLLLEVTIVAVETLGTMVEIQIEGVQVEAVDQGVLQVQAVDQAAAGLLEEIATEDLRVVLVAQEGDK